MHSKNFFKTTLSSICLGTAALMVASCGSSDDNNSGKKSPAGQNEKDGGKEKDGVKGATDGLKKENLEGAGRIADGQYLLSAGSIEGFLQGQRLERTNFAIVPGGEPYTLTIEAKGEERYIVKATGAAKMVINGQQQDLFYCPGSEDIYSFELGKQDDAFLKEVKLGCPQNSQASVARTIKIRPDGPGIIRAVVTETGNGDTATLYLTFITEK
jgi:hypothetical protein